MNSDMSMRTMASSVSKRNSASAFESSVLPTPVGPRKRNEPFGRSVGQARTRAADRVGDGLDRLLLPDDALRQRLLHAQQLLALALEHLGHGDAGPLRDDLGDLLVRDLVAHQGRSLGLGFLRTEPLLELGNPAVLEFRGARQVAGALSGLELEAHSLEFS